MKNTNIRVIGGNTDPKVTEKLRNQPISTVRWVHESLIVANDYNMNKVAPKEMHLLAISILKDGFTMPVVCIYDKEQNVYVLIDGFHRTATVKNNKEVNEMTNGYVPVVVLNKTLADRVQATIRHNRARGKHSTDGMANAVFKLLEQGNSDADIINELGMEAEELIRLKHITGFSKLFENIEYRKAWVDSKQIQIKKEWKDENNNSNN